MANIKLFNIADGIVEYSGNTVTMERELQTLIEKNMQQFFGVRFLASEFVTTNGGRMDSLGIDENHCPVIFEYKRSVSENVINQGLFYLNWLLDHRDSFKVLVIEKLGMEAAKKIEWSMPRVVCIAGDFNKYDEEAIQQMTGNISLIRYKKFGEDLLMFEQLNERVVKPLEVMESSSQRKAKDKSFRGQIDAADEAIKELYRELQNYILSLGDDVTENELRLYIAYKKIRNFVCLVATKSKLQLYLRLDAETVEYTPGFSRDVRNIGHWGTGDVELELTVKENLPLAKSLIERAYHEN